MELSSEVSKVVGEELLDEWMMLSPKVYYRNGKPYGVIGTVEHMGVIYIASSATDVYNYFTKNMIRDIIVLYRNNDVCLMSGDLGSWDRLASVLSRYDFIYEYTDRFMYAFHFKDM